MCSRVISCLGQVLIFQVTLQALQDDQASKDAGEILIPTASLIIVEEMQDEEVVLTLGCSVVRKPDSGKIASKSTPWVWTTKVERETGFFKV